MASDDAELMALTDITLGEAEADIASHGKGDYCEWREKEFTLDHRQLTT